MGLPLQLGTGERREKGARERQRGAGGVAERNWN